MDRHDLARASVADAPRTEWDHLLAAVSTRLHQITGSVGNPGSPSASDLQLCAQALEQLGAELADTDERRHQLELALFDLNMARAMSRATAS